MAVRRPRDRPPLGLGFLVGEGHRLLLQSTHHPTQAGLALAPPHPTRLLLWVRWQVEPQWRLENHHFIHNFSYL